MSIVALVPARSGSKRGDQTCCHVLWPQMLLTVAVEMLNAFATMLCGTIPLHDRMTTTCSFRSFDHGTSSPRFAFQRPRLKACRAFSLPVQYSRLYRQLLAGLPSI